MDWAERNVFPFPAILGQESLKRALMANAVCPQIGGVLIRGEKGTAKSTAARALAALLPDIDVRAGCPVQLRTRRRLPALRRKAWKYPAPQGAHGRSARGGHRGPGRGRHALREGRAPRDKGLRARPAGGRPSRHPLRGRGQPAARPSGRRHPGRGGLGGERGRARRRFRGPPIPLHPGGHHESRRGRGAPPAVGPLRAVRGGAGAFRRGGACGAHAPPPGLRGRSRRVRGAVGRGDVPAPSAHRRGARAAGRGVHARPHARALRPPGPGGLRRRPAGGHRRLPGRHGPGGAGRRNRGRPGARRGGRGHGPGPPPQVPAPAAQAGAAAPAAPRRTTGRSGKNSPKPIPSRPGKPCLRRTPLRRICPTGRTRRARRRRRSRCSPRATHSPCAICPSAETACREPARASAAEPGRPRGRGDTSSAP